MGMFYEGNKVLNGVSGIYRITNKLNGMSYVGGSENIGKRVREHELIVNNLNSAKARTLHRVMREVGADNFQVELLEAVDKKLERAKFLELEQYYIDKYDTIANGYNELRARAKTKVDASNSEIVNVSNNETADDLPANLASMITDIPTYQTTNYSIFKTLKGNRDVNKTRVRKITKNMNEFLVPILVNEKMEVIDGQGRLETVKEIAMKEENYIPILFQIRSGATIADCIGLNQSATGWKLIDYINCFAELGDEDYVKLREIINRYSAYSDIDTIFAVCGRYSDGSPRTSMKSREFKFREDVDVVKAKLEYIKTFCTFFGGKKVPASFGKILLFSYSCDAVDNQKMWDRVKLEYEMSGNRLLVPTANTIAIIGFFNKLYNRGKRGNAVPVASNTYVNIEQLYREYVQMMKDKHKMEKFEDKTKDTNGVKDTNMADITVAKSKNTEAKNNTNGTPMALVK